MVKRMLILDADSYAFKAATAAQTLIPYPNNKHIYTEGWDLRKASEYFKEQLDRLLEITKAETLEIVFGDKANFRKELYPDYKSNRSQKSPIIPLIKENLIKEFNAITLPRLEGDDTCRVLYEDPQFYKGYEKVIVSVDKDFYSVPCKFFRDLPSNTKNEIVHTDPKEALRNLMKQIIMGDKTDGYYGIPDFGEVKTSRFLESNPEATLGDVLELFQKNGLTPQDYIKNKVCASIVGYKNYNQETHQIKHT